MNRAAHLAPVALVAVAGLAAWFVSARLIHAPAPPPAPPRYLPASLVLGTAQRREARIPPRVLTVSQLISMQQGQGPAGVVDVGGWAYGMIPGGQVAS